MGRNRQRGEAETMVVLCFCIVLIIIFCFAAANNKPRDLNLVRCKTTKVIPYEQCYGKKENRTCATQYRHEVRYKWCTKEEAEEWASLKIYVPNEPPKKEKKGDEEQVEELIFLWWLL